METARLQSQSFRIDGMTCVNCQTRIEKKLQSMAGIETASVSYETSKATVTFDASIVTLSDIKHAVDTLGYKALDDKGRIETIAGYLIIIIALYILLRMFSTSSLAMAFPVAQTGMGYGMVLVIGLVTSVHCIAMCGGINLSQTLTKEKREERKEESNSPPIFSSFAHFSFPFAHLFPAILYNTGRIISYTAVGVVVGAIGSVITVSGNFQGAVLLIAGVFMLVMGINMLGLFPVLRRFTPRISLFSKKIEAQKTNKGPLIVGFLNGFMPCGPLQAMQLYALSTGSPIQGGISMFLFCIGTIPLMFALGAASGILSGAKGKDFSRKVVKAGAVLVSAMGLTMFANGWNITGLKSPADMLLANTNTYSNKSGVFVPVMEDGFQIVSSTLLPNRYPAITVQQGIPVRWTINAPQGSINGCNNRILIREYGMEYSFKPGDNVIEFFPEKTGRFSYSCWMGMIRSSITVVAEGESIAALSESAAELNTTPIPAGVDIPVDEIAVAQLIDNYQIVSIQLSDDGFEPAVVILQQGLPALLNIAINSFDPGNSSLIFPSYYTIVDTEQGDNVIQIIPIDDFDFSTVDNIFYGYVKVVDDINNVNIQAIKNEVANFETLIYPDEYFKTATNGRACCR